jgi:hypothetical protein
MRSETLAILSDAVENAPLACAAQTDCVLYVRWPSCVYDCGFVAAAADPSSIDAAVDRVDAELCPEACVQVPSSCGGGIDFEDERIARCDAGECVLRSWSSVYQPGFEASVYPLLSSHCQDCHGATAQSGAPPFAHPDVSRALRATNQLVRWRAQPWGPDGAELFPLVRAVSVRNHGCWSDCADDAAELVAALLEWSQGP